jgi:hypothetical protein
MARLRARGVPVPRAFVLGRAMLAEFTARVRRVDPSHMPVKLPSELTRKIADSVQALGGSSAIRRSPLDDLPPDDAWLSISQGGRPERETYLHLTDAAEVGEAVRRIWGTGLVVSPPPAPVAIIVQRFMAPEVCAVVRRDRADANLLHVSSTLGVGDLLAAGLVVPDRHTVRRDGHVLASSLGRKAQMSVPRPDGGVVRVPVPAHAARLPAIDDAKIMAMIDIWRAAEAAVDGLMKLDLAWSAGRWYATKAAASRPTAHESVMLGYRPSPRPARRAAVHSRFTECSSPIASVRGRTKSKAM